jgi:hypothetical protein
MKIAIDSFRGEIPRTHPRLLPDGFGQEAVSIRFDSGAMVPLRRARLVHTFANTVTSIYKHNDEWLGFVSDTKVVPGPVDGDRLYYTGSLTPKMRFDGVDYELALPAPTTAPTVAIGGTLDALTQERIFYAYTYVTSLGEESAPSPLSVAVEWSSARNVTVGGFAAPVADRLVTARRIYRSQTGASGDTTLFFVKEILLAVTTYAHDVAADPMQEPIPTSDFDLPPATLQGLTAMPNGMMVGFVGKELMFCEPYQPHAWPIKYRLRVDYAIVALSSFGSMLAVLTEGTPYIAQGNHPDSIGMEKMESGQPCISASGVVDLGFAAAYPSWDGLVNISASGTQLISRNLFSKTDWRDIRPETIFAESYDGRYCFSYIADTNLNIGGGAADTDFTGSPVYNAGAAFTPNGLLIASGGFANAPDEGNSLGIIDTTGEQPFFIRTNAGSSINPTGLHMAKSEGVLYIIAEGSNVYEFDSAELGASVLLWRSKVYDVGAPVSFGACIVESEDSTTDLTSLITRIYANGNLIHSSALINQPFRLPGDRLYERWEIEVQGNVSIRSIRLAGSMQELGS